VSQAKRREIMPGVTLTAVKTRKFKTSCIGLNLLVPLHPEEAAKHALLPSVLRRGTAAKPDMEQLSGALDELYGAYMEPSIRKKGEAHASGFICSFIDDAYTPGGEPLLERVCALLGDMLLRPATRNGRFLQDYVEGERDNLIDRIRAQKNDKRQYALLRLTQVMCAGEPFGVSRFGAEESARGITSPKLFSYCNSLLENAAVELFYCGSAPFERVEQALISGLLGLPRATGIKRPETLILRKPEKAEPQLFRESMDVTQGKLSMGFRTGITVADDAYPALMLMSAVFGGTTTSKLFMNVREKLSLCYYASSSLDKHKGLMLVSSGIDFKQFEAARDEILRQLDAVRRGEISDAEMEAARRAMISALRAVLDSQSQLEDFYLGQAAAGLDYGPEDLALLLEDVTKEQVVAAAQQVSLDTIYFLEGLKKEAEHEETAV